MSFEQPPKMLDLWTFYSTLSLPIEKLGAGVVHLLALAEPGGEQLPAQIFISVLTYPQAARLCQVPSALWDRKVRRQAFDQLPEEL